MPNLSRSFAPVVLLALAAVGQAEIRYQVRHDPTSDRLTILMRFKPEGAMTTLQMPSWSPGLYVREDYWESMADVAATDEKGAALPIVHSRGDTWTVSTGATKEIVVRYTRPVDRSTARMGMFASSGPAIHYTGPATYLYVVGRKEESCSVGFDLGPNGRVAVGLVQKNGRYVAKSYDELADATVTLGEFLTSDYVEAGRRHELAFRGPGAANLDRAKVTRMARFVTKSITDFFGGAPYPKYVWHIMAGPPFDGAGGVEHLNGTDIFVGGNPGPGAMRGMAHEFFHLYNVKRIRERDLGPFDYTQLPKAGSLWWLEGVTDYYASLRPFRAGAWDGEAFLKDAARNVADIRSNPARLEVSPFDSGFRTPESKSNSSGYRVNYYPTGWVLGMMFDLELRARTNGKRSLDDVELALWKLCKDGKPGFEKDEIRGQLVRFGGPAMGDLYD
ncbi:hypothetical protein EON82_14350, partial [bacterium]